MLIVTGCTMREIRETPIRSKSSHTLDAEEMKERSDGYPLFTAYTPVRGEFKVGDVSMDEHLLQWYRRNSSRVASYARTRGPLDGPCVYEESDEDGDESDICAAPRAKATATSKQQRESQERIGGKKHDFEGVCIWTELPGDIMELVMSGSAIREQLWVLDGVLVRSMLAADEPFDRAAFCVMWFALFKARTGKMFSRGISEVDDLLLLRRDLVRCRPQDSLFDNHFQTWKSYSVEQHDWLELFERINVSRMNWKSNADVMSCAHHACYTCPYDAQFDVDWRKSMGAPDVGFVVEPVSDIGVRVKACPSFKRARVVPENDEGGYFSKKSRYGYT